MFKKVLVAFDGSQGAAKAFEVGLDVARKYDAELLALAVVRLPEPTTSLELDAILDGTRAEYERLLAELAQKTAYPKLRTDVAVGHPAEQIVARAEGDGVDLIVMGRRGVSRMTRWMLGSVSERVLRYAHCPVMVVK